MLKRRCHGQAEESEFRGLQEAKCRGGRKVSEQEIRRFVVGLERIGGITNNSKALKLVQEEADYLTVNLKHGPQYIILAAGRWGIIVDSGASRGLICRRGMFTTYKQLHNMFVYTASGEPISVIGTNTVGGIPCSLYVPTLEEDLL